MSSKPDSKSELWYIIDHSNKLSHPAIFHLYPKKADKCLVNGEAGMKFELASGRLIYAEKTSVFSDIDSALVALTNLASKVARYIQDDKRMILDAEIENAIMEP